MARRRSNAAPPAVDLSTVQLAAIEIDAATAAREIKAALAAAQEARMFARATFVLVAGAFLGGVVSGLLVGEG